MPGTSRAISAALPLYAAGELLGRFLLAQHGWRLISPCRELYDGSTPSFRMPAEQTDIASAFRYFHRRNIRGNPRNAVQVVEVALPAPKRTGQACNLRWLPAQRKRITCHSPSSLRRDLHAG